MAEGAAANFSYLMKVVRKADLLLSKEKKQVEKQMVQAARTFATSHGKDIVRTAARDIPSVAEMQGSLVARPTDRAMLGFERRIHVEPRTEAASIAALAFDSEEGAVRSKTRNLGVGLDAYWSARMRPICEGEWDGKPDEPRKETACFKAGHCLCSVSGRQLYRFATRFLEQHKLMTMKGTSERALMKDGYLVWRLRGTPREPLFAGLATGVSSGSEGIDEDTYVYWHVSLVLLSPYVPVFQVLECERTDQGEKPGPHEELAVKAMQLFLLQF